jgi:CubicO group peptidase (beta-lactamase class C family)
LDRGLYNQSIVALKNDRNLLPLRRFDTLNLATLSMGSAELTSFQQMLENYTSVRHFNALKDVSGSKKENLIKQLKKYNLVLAGIHGTTIYPWKKFGIHPSTLKFLDELADSTNVVLVLFASPYSLEMIDNPEKYKAILLAHQDVTESNEMAAQMIMGSTGCRGKLPVSVLPHFPIHSGLTIRSLNRLQYAFPQEVGIPSKALEKIDSIALKSIRDEEIPGCQILVAYQGKVIYKKAFGYHTYKKGVFVNDTDIYDLASITKIAATTASIMWLYDQKKLDIDHKLVWYLPYLYGTNKEYIIVREMMAHQAKLKPWIPFYQATLLDGQPDKRYYSKKLDEKHTVKVADKLFIRNDYAFTLFDTIIHSDLRKRNGYKYSDLGFYLLKQAIENLTNKPLDKFVEETFYRQLGMQHTMYNPLGRVKKQKIVPTEEDTYFRHQLIHGYVHDPGAAMLGGVAGHAGLFSNANDMAIFMQMLLNGGMYGGTRYLRASTVSQFTKQQFPLEENRRAIGFDKPDPQDPENGPTCEEASLLSFGHTGFTGTYAWADPEHDLIYIFLSNRIHPTARNTKLIRNNTRTEIQKIIYQALPEKKKAIADRDEMGALPFAK